MWYNIRSDTVTPREIKETLQNYNWMIKELRRQRELADEDIRLSVTAQGGIESSMPKPKGITSDPVANEIIRRDKKYTWLNNLEKKLSYIQNRIHVIKDERERVVLECLLDGMSMRAIGQHLELSEKHITRLRDGIAEQMSEMSKMSDTLHV